VSPTGLVPELPTMILIHGAGQSSSHLAARLLWLEYCVADIHR